jgi:multiple sugar transport system substrate-binding protein
MKYRVNIASFLSIALVFTILLNVWAQAGQESERSVLERQVARFNQNRPETQARHTLIPEGSYNAQIQAAAITGELPDMIELDGPFLSAYAWQGHLQPLDELRIPTLAQP